MVEQEIEIPGNPTGDAPVETLAAMPNSPI